MENKFFKKIALLLTITILASILVPPFIYADEDDEADEIDVSVVMMAFAHANINSINRRDQLKDMKANYNTLYNNMLNNPDLNDNQRDEIIDIRDKKIAAIDDKIEYLQIMYRRRKRALSPVGIIGGILGGGKKVITGIGRAVGKGIEAAGNSVVLMIKDPRRLIQTTLSIMATGGVSSFKDALITILKSNVTRAGKKAAYAELLKCASKNKALSQALGLEDYENKKEDDNEDENEDDEDIGPEGEGGYDDEDNDDNSDDNTNNDEENNDEENNDEEELSIDDFYTILSSDYYDLTGTYTLESYDLVPCGAEGSALGVSYEQPLSANCIGTTFDLEGSIRYFDGFKITLSSIAVDAVSLRYDKDSGDVSVIKYFDNTVYENGYYNDTFETLRYIGGYIDDITYHDMVYQSLFENNDGENGTGSMIFYLDANYYLHIEGTFNITDLYVTVDFPKIYNVGASYDEYRTYQTSGLATAEYSFECVSNVPLQ